ncbi:YadA-like family protein [Luteibacter sp. 3190]|uniref:beta strand repeat-containing protein n=1 Tax=Luteibacter sp. 3190 TaxID=2817736 RepID=UPI00285B137E|nr:YadA-like family protein [Luteibacter sp. 3190]MDR6935322.1 autotransporter adhesin [Luteibacter sp. 3190]
MVAVVVGAALAFAVPSPVDASVIYTSAGVVCNNTTGAQNFVGADGTTSQSTLTDGSGFYSIVAGCGANGSNALAVTLFGGGSQVTADYGTAVGFLARAGNLATAVGTQAAATGSSSFAAGYNALASGTQALAIGALSNGMKTTASGSFSIALGGAATASGVETIGIGTNATATSNQDQAIGTAASAQGTGTGLIFQKSNPSNTSNFAGLDPLDLAVAPGAATALGSASHAKGTSASAIGDNANALANGATALGGLASASAANATAVGLNAFVGAAGTSGIAIGRGATVNGAFGIAQGDGVISGATGRNVAIGSTGTAANAGSAAGGAVAIGRDQHATGDGAVAIGDPNVVNGTGAVAMGANNTAAGNTAGTLAGNGAVAIGNGNLAIGQGAVALGNGSQANNAGSLAFGDAAIVGAGATQALAIGSGAIAGDASAVALGAGSVTAAAVGTTSATINGATYTFAGTAPGSTVSIGAAGTERTMTNLAAGRISGTSTDAINGSQLFATNQALETLNNAVETSATHYYSVNDGGTVGGNHDNDGASGLNALAAGVGASAAGTSSTAVGADTTAAGLGSVALGHTAMALADFTVAIGDTVSVAAAAGAGSIVAGHNSQVNSGIGGIALGEGQTSNGNGAVAVGGTNSANGDGAVAIGTGDRANGRGAVALGNGSTAQGQGSIALGNASSALAPGSIAMGDGATAGGAGYVALGSGSITDSVVNTTDVTISGATYAFAGTAATSSVSIGAAGAERTLTNVAAGRISGSSTDAINGSQLFATNQALEALDTAVEAGATHYYSVNDNGTPGANYANDGASGLNALAAGVGATATADGGTALGQGAGVSVLGGVALGSGAVSDRAIAPASGSILVGTNVIPYNTTDRNLLGSVSVGNTTDFRQITNVADGTEDQDAVTLRQLKGAMSSFSVTPIQYFHANSTATDSAAIGAESVAIGPQTTVNGDNGIGMGNGAIVQQTAPGGTAIGQNAAVNLADGIALGSNATSNGIQAIALGTGAQAAFAGSVALGAGSSTDAAVGTANAVISGTTYTFAGTMPGSTVSVGAAGAERTLTNLAAGRIDGGSTDAVNGSQLFATSQAIDSVAASVTNLGNTVTNFGNSIANSIGGGTTYDPTTGTVNTSLNYAGNTYNSVQQVFDQINTNGIKYFHANSSLADSIAASMNSVAIGPASNANTENAVSIGNGATAGSNLGDVALGAGSTTATVLQTAGTTIAGTAYTYAGGAPTSTVSIGSAGAERTITNLAAGRVSGSSTDAINGSQLFATNQAIDSLNTTVINNATHYYSVNDNGITTGGNYDNNGATGLNAVASGVGSVATATGATAVGQNTNASIEGSVALGAGAVSDRAIAPASGSITAGTHVIPFNTSDRTLLGAVSVGNTTDFRQITNVADGTEDQDAVTLRQLKGALSSFAVTPTEYFHANSTAADSAAIGAESIAVGPETTVNGDNGIGIGNHSIVAQTAPGGTAIGQNSTTNLADGVAIGTGATSNGIQAMALGAGSQAAFAGSVALGSGSSTDAAVGTTSTTLAGVSYNFAGATPGSTVSVGSAGAERTITNLAAGRIAGTSTDAINGSQLYATNQTLELLGSQIINLSNAINNFPSGGNGGSTNNTYNNSGDNNTPSSATGNNSTAIGAGSSATGDNSVALGAGSVANTSNSVSVGSVGHERTVTNVANGVSPTDAANVGQVDQALQEAKNWSKDYVDQRFQTVDRDLNRIGNRANAGVASAMAMASLPQAYQPNQNSAAVAVGSFHGETGVAVGMSTITESGRYVFKLNATTNSRGDAGAGIGAGVVW